MAIEARHVAAAKDRRKIKEEHTMTFKEKVAAAAPMTGTHVHLTDPIVTEIFASLGYDFIWVDMEHTHMSC